MGLRDENAPGSFGTFGDFFLSPSLEGIEASEKERDRWRLIAFNMVAGICAGDAFGEHPIPDSLRDAIAVAAQKPKSPTATRLFERMREISPPHRLVLLKAAAEWVVSRYQRGMQNWVHQHAQWKEERDEWERAHPELTPEIRDCFTNVFKQLNDPKENGKPGVRRKNPRICLYERLKPNLDNCIYAGEKGHDPHCWKYEAFIKAQKERNPSFNPDVFWRDAERFVAFCAEKNIKPANAFLSPHVPHVLFKGKQPQARIVSMRRLKENWGAYLKHMGLTSQTVMSHGRLPHCSKIGGKTHEKSQCQWNRHTDLCKQYKHKLDQFDELILAQEPAYREWRKSYLSGPSKPAFRLPSSRTLPMPKIFGDGFYEIDFDRSILRLRLDDIKPVEWLEFGFIPWPRRYPIRRKDVTVTSVHVNFIGSRARVGFRFNVQHKPSRFACSQDELDELRSRCFPRRAQDEQYLEAARQRLLDSFSGDPSELRLLAVDLGLSGAHAAVYAGKKCECNFSLAIVKINQAYTELPEKLEKNPKDTKMRGSLELAQDPESDKINDARGVRKEHISRHLQRISDGASEVAVYRSKHGAPADATQRNHDFRNLKRHVRWMIRDWVRHNVSQIIAAAEKHQCDLIVFESLRNQKVPGYERKDDEAVRQKQEQAILSFGRIRHKVKEKAVERGMRVVTVPDFKSSRVCSACGHEQRDSGRLTKNKRSRKFICECGDPKVRKDKKVDPECQCTEQLNSDANAARVLARVFWDEIKLPLPDPPKT